MTDLATSRPSGGGPPQVSTGAEFAGGVRPDLPFDIIHTLLDYTSIFDLVNLCSTCRALRVHLKNESLWRRVCLSYGLKDLAYFPGQSAYSIYTQLLHPYGPLIGLWANDSPFYGKVMEFRLFPGDESEQGGILGEVWVFSSTAPPDSPVPPSYTRAVKISFEDEVSPSSKSPETPDGIQPSAVHVLCCPTRATIGGPAIPSPPPHRCSLVRLSATSLGKFLQFYRKKVILPDFPAHISPWYDRTRGCPRIMEIPEIKRHSGEEEIKLYPAARLPAVFVAPTAVVKPAAMSIHCPLPASECPSHSLHTTTLPFPNLDLRPPRYYPLKDSILHGVEPDAYDWAADCLDGLWYGSYGPNGTECIYLAHDDERDTVEATKITGDVHVPRGCVSWMVRLAPANQRQTLQGYWASLRPESGVPHQLLIGHGTIAGRGFTDMAIVELMAGVMSADQIDIFWAELHEFRTYKRYKGRPTATA
ncbi:hypothetical protein C8Q78DRAFT_1114255 [Trametes maxima]|nr:hypothetical protein C8Q78DRAFT_1114255 [Trametes maxima]